MAVRERMLVPVGCDGCHGDHRRRVCLGSRCRSSGTCPGLWLSPTTGSQTFHPREVWHSPQTHARTHMRAGQTVVQKEDLMLWCHLHSVTHLLPRLSGWVLERPLRPSCPSVPPPSGGGSMRLNINGVRFCVRYTTWPAGWRHAHLCTVTSRKCRMHSQHASTRGRH